MEYDLENTSLDIANRRVVVRGCSSDTKSPQIKSHNSWSSKGKFEHKKPHEPIYKDSIIIVASKTIYTNQSIKVNSWEWKKLKLICCNNDKYKTIVIWNGN
jgi:hypothetical protein